MMDNCMKVSLLCSYSACDHVIDYISSRQRTPVTVPVRLKPRAFLRAAFCVESMRRLSMAVRRVLGPFFVDSQHVEQSITP